MKIDFSKIVRQGDIQLVPVSKIPTNAKLQKGEHVLQASEVTGNFHKFKPDAGVKIFQTKEEPDLNHITPDLGKFIAVDNLTFLYHGKENEYNPTPGLDHSALTVVPGFYQVRITREYSRKGIKKIVD